MDALKVLLSLRARGVAEVLGEQAELRRRSRAGEEARIPLVTLHLRSGRDVHGWVLDRSESPGGALLFHAPGRDLDQPRHDALYLSQDSIEAITVHDAGGLGLEPPRKEPPPGRLQLNRKAKDLEASLTQLTGEPVTCEISWAAVRESGDPLWGLDDTIESTRSVLVEIARDDLGREALKKVSKVLFAVGPKPSVSALQGELVVNTTLEGRERRLSRAELSKAIHAAL